MRSETPLTSVLLPSYGHRAYIGKVVESVLVQDFQDYELLISDDASPDGSWDVIQSFKDPRIRSFRQERNLGPVGNYSFLVNEARGKYVALINSDDLWLPGKLSRQVRVMESDPALGACFTWAELVYPPGTDPAVMDEELDVQDIFKEADRSQGSWLRRLLLQGNCLCHPSVLIRKDAFLDVGLCNPAFRQLPDYELWTRLLKKHPIRMVAQVFVQHLRTGANTSSTSPENKARLCNETVRICLSFFDGMSLELFQEAFGDLRRRKDLPLTPVRAKCERLFLLLACEEMQQPATTMAAILLLLEDAREPEFERVLRDEYAFSLADVYKLTGAKGLGSFETYQDVLRTAEARLAELASRAEGLAVANKLMSEERSTFGAKVGRAITMAKRKLAPEGTARAKAARLLVALASKSEKTLKALLKGDA